MAEPLPEQNLQAEDLAIEFGLKGAFLRAAADIILSNRGHLTIKHLVKDYNTVSQAFEMQRGVISLGVLDAVLTVDLKRMPDGSAEVTLTLTREEVASVLSSMAKNMDSGSTMMVQQVAA